MPVDFLHIILLIASGFFVGFINTLAGGGTIISLSIFMMMGLSPAMANGTNRIPIIFQNITSTYIFYKKGILDLSKGLRLSIPTALGAVGGAVIAVDIDESVFKIAISIIVLSMLFFMIYKPEKWLKGNTLLSEKPIKIWMYVLFFGFGIYGGFVHLGIGYLFLAALVLGLGFDLLHANAIKGLLVLLYTPASFLVFFLSGQVNLTYGILHAIGNIIGAYTASIWAIHWGSNFIRWVIIGIIILFSLELLGIFQISF